MKGAAAPFFVRKLTVSSPCVIPMRHWLSSTLHGATNSEYSRAFNGLPVFAAPNCDPLSRAKATAAVPIAKGIQSLVGGGDDHSSKVGLFQNLKSRNGVALKPATVTLETLS